MSYELFISLRYLKAKRKQAFISLISLISIGGVAVGVAALILVLAVMTGFKSDIRDKVLGTMPHITVQQPVGLASDYRTLLERLQKLEHVFSVSPTVTGQVLLGAGEYVTGIKVVGIDSRQGSLNYLEQRLVEGHVDYLNVKHLNKDALGGPQRDGVIIGREVARMLGVGTGDDITMILPQGRILPIGTIPKLKKFRVVGIMSSGFYEYDAGLAYISLTAAQRFFSMGDDISELEVRLDNVYHTKSMTASIRELLGGNYHIQDWTELNQSLFSAINLEKLAMFLILALIILVAAFNIISTLVMMVMEKQTDIATLKSLGATSASILKIFMLEGVVIGCIGTLIGTGLGVFVGWAADTYKWIRLNGGSYYLDYLRFEVTAQDVLLVVLISLSICFVSTIYPARQASKLDPVTIFRYE
ncbi:lipoprotein-releasing system transmembrane subunit LolC [candidate division KSB3 bacterium]|uniref:Lipoprotein-releasing system transmembrane subunit LolC n=1 Tax=candidate division KSB3 bacterium TaxID=2044937 RepID=A0A2G6KFQ6_9BACT|nr:MAG: lipoprotein-releasing system transmembrane subunit LolC [candidate division KSB3 bacterium]